MTLYTTLGKTESGQIIKVDKESRRQHMYLIGSTGTGKTGLLSSMILQDINAVDGPGVCVIDPNGGLIKSILERVENRTQDIILCDLTDQEYVFGINLYECADPNNDYEIQKVISSIQNIFEKIFGSSQSTTPHLLYVLRNCARTIIDNNLTMAEIPRLLKNDAFRKRLVANVRDMNVAEFWEDVERMNRSEKRAFDSSNTNKIDAFVQPVSRAIVGQVKSTLDFRDIMDSRKILLIKLDKELPEVSSLLGGVIISHIARAAYSRESIPDKKRKQFHLYCDEMHLFLTDSMADMLTQVRQYGVGFAGSHQIRSDLTEKMRDATRNVGTIVAFRINGRDAEDIVTELDIQLPSVETIPHTVPRNVLDYLATHSSGAVKRLHTEICDLKEKMEAYPDQLKEFRREGHWRYDMPSTQHPPDSNYSPENVKPLLRELESYLYESMRYQDDAGIEQVVDSFSRVFGYWRYASWLSETRNLPADIALQREQEEYERHCATIKQIEEEIAGLQDCLADLTSQDSDLLLQYYTIANTTYSRNVGSGDKLIARRQQEYINAHKGEYDQMERIQRSKEQLIAKAKENMKLESISTAKGLLASGRAVYQQKLAACEDKHRLGIAHFHFAMSNSCMHLPLGDRLYHAYQYHHLCRKWGLRCHFNSHSPKDEVFYTHVFSAFSDDAKQFSTSGAKNLLEYYDQMKRRYPSFTPTPLLNPSGLPYLNYETDDKNNIGFERYGWKEKDGSIYTTIELREACTTIWEAVREMKHIQAVLEDDTLLLAEWEPRTYYLSRSDEHWNLPSPRPTDPWEQLEAFAAAYKSMSELNTWEKVLRFNIDVEKAIPAEIQQYLSLSQFAIAWENGRYEGLKDGTAFGFEKIYYEEFYKTVKRAVTALIERPIRKPAAEYEHQHSVTRTFKDVQAELAGAISTLPDYTAYARITEEHRVRTEKIQTFEPSKPRRNYKNIAEEIRARNIQQGYLRPREEVEQEIRRRQEPPSPTVRKHPI